MVYLSENDFNILYVIIPVVIVLLIILIGVLVHNKKKNDFINERKEAGKDIINNLGGLDNIISAKANGSRLSLVLNDYSLVNDDNLKSLGVSTIIKMSNKITLVIGEESKDIESYINKN